MNERKPFDRPLFLKRIGVVIGAIVAAVAALEIGVRMFAPQELISDVMQLGGPLCHRLEPGIRGVQRSAEYAVDVQINEQGLRDHYHAHEKRDGVFRILMLGDSHTFGWGVAMEEAFPQLLEGSLNTSRNDATTYEVINTGTIGFGTGHQYQYLTTTGVQFEPDLVVIVVDFVHDVVANNQRYMLRDGIPTRNAMTCVFESSRSLTSFVPFAGVLRGRSHAFRFFGTRATGVFRRVAGGLGTAEAQDRSDHVDVALTQRIIEATRDDLAESGIDFAVVILPEFRAYEEDDLHAFEAFLLDREIAYVSLGAVIGEGFFPSALTYEVSPHFNASGHRFLAEQIQRFLETSGKIDGFTSPSSSGGRPTAAPAPRR